VVTLIATIFAPETHRRTLDGIQRSGRVSTG